MRWCRVSARCRSCRTCSAGAWSRSAPGSAMRATPTGTSGRDEQPGHGVLVEPAGGVMHFFRVLATDYDGTLAHDGALEARTVAALERLKASGRALVLVTGRELDDLKSVCHRLDLFDLVVAENGALLYEPGAGEELLLTQPPSLVLVERLKAAGVPRISVGRSIIAT